MKKVLVFMLVFCLTASFLGCGAAAVKDLQQYVIGTDSMKPAFDKGDTVYVDPKTTFESIKVGDAIMYRNMETGIHFTRVVAIEDGALITKCDNNEENDADPVTAEELVGKVVKIKTALGTIVDLP